MGQGFIGDVAVRTENLRETPSVHSRGKPGARILIRPSRLRLILQRRHVLWTLSCRFWDLAPFEDSDVKRGDAVHMSCSVLHRTDSKFSCGEESTFPKRLLVSLTTVGGHYGADHIEKMVSVYGGQNTECDVRGTCNL